MSDAFAVFVAACCFFLRFCSCVFAIQRSQTILSPDQCQCLQDTFTDFPTATLRYYLCLIGYLKAMQVARAVRRLCTLRTHDPSIMSFDSLSFSLRSEARRIASAMHAARNAVAIAAEDSSDDEERKDAMLKVKHVLKKYSQLAAQGDPPVQLTDHGKPIEDEEFSENNVTRLFQSDIDAMKQEIFDSNRQRVWIGWWGWF